MAIPGWYIDPAGTPGRFRYWDGQQWSAGTTADPRDPPPRPARGSAPRPARTARSRTPLIIGVVVAAVLLVAAIAIAVIVRQPATVNPPVSSAPATIPPESAGPGGPAATPQPSTPCPVGDPTIRQPPVGDDRIHGGGLSFPQQPNYLVDGPRPDLSWAYDVSSQSRPVDPTWSSSFAVGALLTADGFETPKRAAALVMACTAPSPMYVGFTDRTDLTTRAVKVDGHPGYAIRSEIRVNDPSTTQTGDVVEVIVVDGDSPESLGMFWACVPLGDPVALAQLDEVVRQLRVD